MGIIVDSIFGFEVTVANSVTFSFFDNWEEPEKQILVLELGTILYYMYSTIILLIGLYVECCHLQVATVVDDCERKQVSGALCVVPRLHISFLGDSSYNKIILLITLL